jgi:hypothetical protein
MSEQSPATQKSPQSVPQAFTLSIGHRHRQSAIVLEGDVARVELTSGLWATIDAADVPLVEGVAWSVSSATRENRYATRSVNRGGVRTNIQMHRLILASPAEMAVDHINGDGLDNRRANLRLCSHAENMRNKRGANKLGAKGVHQHGRKFYATIERDGERKRVGPFDTVEEAGAAYAEMARYLHGDFAR